MLKNILITGGSGLLATCWSRARAHKDNIFLVEHNQSCSSLNGVPVKVNLGSIEAIIASIKLNKIDVCVHAAGLTSVEICEKNPSMADFLNATLAQNVAIACSSLHIPLISISTDHLFSGNSSLSDETQAIEPVNIYALSKAKGESLTIEEHPNALVIRTNFYGWGPDYRPSFSDYIYYALSNGRSVQLFTDVFYTPVIATYLANAAHELLEKGVSGIVNVVGSERLTKYEFGIKLAEVFNLNQDLIIPAKIAECSNLISRPHDMSLSNAKYVSIMNSLPPSLHEQLLDLKMQRFG